MWWASYWMEWTSKYSTRIARFHWENGEKLEVWSRPFWDLFRLTKGRIYPPLAARADSEDCSQEWWPGKRQPWINKWGGAARQLLPGSLPEMEEYISYRWLAMCTCSVFYMFHVEWLPGDELPQLICGMSQTWEQWPKSESTVVEHFNQSHWDWSWLWCRSTVVHQLCGEIAGGIPKSQQFLHLSCLGLSSHGLTVL